MYGRRNLQNARHISAVQTACENIQPNARPAALIMEASKSGTGVEAVKLLEEKNFRGVISDVVSSCVQRSKELSEK